MNKLDFENYRVVIYLTDDAAANSTAANISQDFVDNLRRETNLDLRVDGEVFRGWVTVCNGTVMK